MNPSSIFDVMHMRQDKIYSARKMYFSNFMVQFEKLGEAKFLKIASPVGLAFILNFSVVNAEPVKSLPYLTCSVPGYEQKETALASNLELISLDVKLTRLGDQPFQNLWVPSNKKDWISRSFGIDKKMNNRQKKSQKLKSQKQTVFIQVLSASSKKEIPFTVVTQGIGRRLNEETVSLLLEIPLDTKSKQAKVDEFYKRLNQKRTTATGKRLELSPKEKYDQFKSKSYLMNSISEHRVGKFIIHCKYIATQDKFWKGQLIADPLTIEVKNNGSFWDRLTTDNKKVVIGDLPSKPKTTKPKVNLNELGKELERLAYRFPDRPGKADLPKVIEGLNDSQSSTRQMALNVLMPIITHNRALEIQGHNKEVDLNQHPKVLTSLLKMVRDPDPKNRSGAIIILSIGFKPSVKIQTAIFEQMRTEDSKEVKMTALNFIQQTGKIPKERQSILVDTLNSKDKGLSRQAATTMGAIRMESGLPLLVEKFESSKINGNFEAYYRAIYSYKNEATPYLPKLEVRLKEVDKLLKKTQNKKDKRKIRFIQSGLRNVIDKIRKLESNG